MVKNLSHQAGLPMPKAYIIPQQSPNAFATGRNPKHAAVAATEGIMRLLDDDELSGVMAHELAHVKHRDTLTSTVAATFAGAIAMLGQIGMISQRGKRRQNPIGGLLLIIGAPVAAILIRMAISRVREYAADRGGARISGKPRSLASALSKIHTSVRRMPLNRGNPAHSHLFIVNPFLGGLANLMSTHPPVKERIRRLEEIAREYDASK
jgi:heat shock protein HtpX